MATTPEEPFWRRNKLPHKQRFLSPCTIEIEPELSMTLHQRGDTGSAIWDASLVLAGYLANKKMYPEGLKDKRVVEIGSGCGVTGIVASKLGADIIMTDLADEMDLLERNVAENLTDEEKTRTKAVELFWGEDASHVNPPFDIVLGADVVYEIQLFPELRKTLVDLCGPNTIVLLGLEHRWADIEKWFFDELKRHFRIELVPRENHHPVFSHPAIDIYILKRKFLISGQ